MKRKLFTFLLILLATKVSFASCDDQYRSSLSSLEKSWTQDTKRRNKVISDAASASIYVPVGVVSIAAATADLASPGGGSLAVMFLAGATVSLSGGFEASVDISKQIHPVDAMADLKLSLDLLSQAETGDGIELRSLTDEINNKCVGKYDTPFNVETIAKMIHTRNLSNDFCNAQGVALSTEIKRLVMQDTDRACK